ncbi:retrovirus-related pol polyprotein LINE-1 [Tanacetum coccineum]|uniref:Retrovirus-related pol polyprotein LINE-1 n=1 Tax=Tanacetum coccineum TaxID=301880 RepID=A0ABQ5B363_9ASTR
MKLWERVIGRRMRRVTTVFENQFGFIPGRSSVEAIHLIRSLMEKYRVRQRDLHMAFLDLENAYDNVPRELIWRTLVDKGTPRRYIKVIRDMYNGVKTRVRTSIENTKSFPVKNIPWWLILSDDIVLASESAKGLNIRLENWREALEVNGLWVSREKTEYLRCDFGKVETSHNDKVDIRGLTKTVAIRPAILYVSGCWPITKSLANRVEVAELRMLRWTCGKTVLDMIPNGAYRAELEVETIINKMREGRLRWFRHVRRRPQSAPVRRIEALVVDDLRRMGRPKLEREDRGKHDMKELLLS